MLNNNLIYMFYYGWWKNIDKPIFLTIVLLFALGLFFSLASTSLIASGKLNTNSYFFFFRHLAYICLGVFVIIFFSSLSQKNLFRISICLLHSFCHSSKIPHIFNTDHLCCLQILDRSHLLDLH